MSLAVQQQYEHQIAQVSYMQRRAAAAFMLTAMRIFVRALGRQTGWQRGLREYCY